MTLRFATVLALTLAAALPAAAATVCTGWEQLPVNNQDQCLETGRAAVQGAGFSAGISNDRQTVFGWRGEEALVVRCIGNIGVAVIFAYVEDSSGDSGPLVDRIKAVYRGGGAPFTGARGGGAPGAFGGPVKR